MMIFNALKNTVLFSIIIGIVLMISCGSKSKEKDGIQMQDDRRTNDQVMIVNNIKDDEAIIVGANQTEAYLHLLQGKRVGVVANQTSVIFKDEALDNEQIATSQKAPRNDDYTHLVDSLLALNIDIKKVFAPEHGFRGTADAGEHVKDDIDTKTNLPLISLHGKHRKPSQQQLENIDIMIFDIQDVGVRFYTYISTLHYVMEACAEAEIPLIIFDRPNPNGHYIDGPTLEIEHQSFLGMHPIPLVHGMTIGEYAQMINGEKWLTNGLKCNITIIPVKHYTHDTFYSLPIRPSPNLPNDQSIKLYPSLGLFEGTNVNAGRGTEFQFQRYGAPFLDKENLTFTYTPVANFGAKNPKHKNKLCYGEDLKDEALNGVMTLKWIMKAYEHSTDKSLFFLTNGFTKHAGTKQLQKQIEAGLSEDAIKETWQENLKAFKKVREKYLIYD
ncbi:exo-beta-N-acetylmuramidase NamZ family protein [Gelatiniphilus marinus]|uniref:Exo-beta-N-acetylmuramidase NamZ domain-containing protein n=1 Tax=Gelatiniphilus marinus TaxID=1759464 RepID=A0ABW5JNX0_9FLAO